MAWDSEATGFTPWLANEKNLQLLSETIGIDLELDSQERSVGPFRADILCKDAATDHWVLIENQLERTDHTHLGQLLTYAAGLQAVTIVWVAERFTDEHRAALDWLNEATSDEFNFFGLEIELWQIGDSEIAPKFNVISHPNEWSRRIRDSVKGVGEPSEHKQLQRRFWTGFRDYLDAHGGPVRPTQPMLQHWMNHALGRSGTRLSSCLSLSNSRTGGASPEIRAEVGLHGRDARPHFAELETQREEIERSLGFPLVWHAPEGKKQCRIFVQQDADFTDERLWPEQFEWLRTRLDAMHRVFAPLARRLGQGGG
jgi:hypothetical protein